MTVTTRSGTNPHNNNGATEPNLQEHHLQEEAQLPQQENTSIDYNQQRQTSSSQHSETSSQRRRRHHKALQANQDSSTSASDPSDDDLEDPIHWMQKIVKLTKHTAGLNLLPKFNGTNWQDFKSKIEMQFTVMGINTYLQHHPSSTSKIERRNDELARTQICLRLTSTQYKQVASCSTTKDVWEKLTSIYDESPVSKAKSLFQTFLHHKKEPSQTMKAYLDQLLEIYHDLQTYKIKIGELGFIVKALDGLPEGYAQVKAAAHASGMDKISKLSTLLITSEKEQQNTPAVQDIKSLHTETRNNNRNYRNKRNNYKCTRCRRDTHTNEQCWILHPHLRPNNSNNGNEVNTQRNPCNSQRQHVNHTTEHVRHYQEPEQFTGFVTTQDLQQGIDLIIDTGANISMTNDKTLLWNYQDSNYPRHVTSSSGQKSPVKGEGSLHISRHNIIISNVLYVPKLTKTIISTKSLTKQGLIIYIDDKMIICNQQGNNLIDVKERNGLYYIPKEIVKRFKKNSTTIPQTHKKIRHGSTERLQYLPSSSEEIKISKEDRELCGTSAPHQLRRTPLHPGKKSHHSMKALDIEHQLTNHATIQEEAKDSPQEIFTTSSNNSPGQVLPDHIPRTCKEDTTKSTASEDWRRATQKKIQEHQDNNTRLLQQYKSTYKTRNVNNKWSPPQQVFKIPYQHGPLVNPVNKLQIEESVQRGGEQRTCRLDTALYELTQAGRTWQDMPNNLQHDEGIKNLKPNVDTGNTIQETQATHTYKETSPSQQEDAKETVQELKQPNCKTIKIPEELHDQEEHNNEDIKLNFPVHQAIGYLTYLTHATLPYLTTAVHNVARHTTKKAKNLWKARQCTVRHLTTLYNIGTHYLSHSSLNNNDCDTNIAGDKTKRKPTKIWTYKPGINTVPRKTNKKKNVTMSTTKAEYATFSGASSEDKWPQELQTRLQHHSATSTTVRQDTPGDTKKPIRRHAPVEEECQREQKIFCNSTDLAIRQIN